MKLPEHDLIGPLYFGTKEDAMPAFLRPSFDGVRPRRSPTSPILLTANFVTAYEAGAYEEYGSVLEIWLRRGARWRFRPAIQIQQPSNGAEGPTIDLTTEDRRGLHAIRVGSGEI